MCWLMMPCDAAAQEKPEAIVVEVPESVPDPTDLFDQEVHRFGGPVGLAGGVVGQDLRLPVPGGAGQGVQLGDVAFIAVAVEAVQGSAGRGSAPGGVDLAEQLHRQPGGGHVAVGVAELQFYAALGYEVVGEVRDTPLGHLSMLKQSDYEFGTIELVDDSKQDEIQLGGGLSHLVVQVESMDGVLERLAAGGEDVEAPTSPDGSDEFLTAWAMDATATASSWCAGRRARRWYVGGGLPVSQTQWALLSRRLTRRRRRSGRLIRSRRTQPSQGLVDPLVVAGVDQRIVDAIGFGQPVVSREPELRLELPEVPARHRP